MLNRLKLGTKFSLILLVVFLIGILGGGIILNRVLEKQAEEEVTNQSLLLLETMNGVRTYTSQQVNPLLQEQQAEQDEFISQSVPAFSARQVFENFRANDNENFVYKEATIDPTNRDNLADGFELEVIEAFIADMELAETTGFRTKNGVRQFYIARPITIGSESCLVCHSEPENAPVALINTYGDQGGFHWEVGEIVGAQIIYVPAEDVFNSARQSFITMILIFLAIFAAVLVVLNVVMRPTLVNPIGLLATMARKVGDEDISESELNDFEMAGVVRRGDELGQLARTFKQMAQQVYKREQNLKRQVNELRVEVDSSHKMNQVSAITESEYFQSLQRRAAEMRKRRADDDSSAE